MPKLSQEAQKLHDKLYREASIYAARRWNDQAVTAVNIDFFGEWNVTVTHSRTNELLYSRTWPKWEPAIRYFENINQPVPEQPIQHTLF